MNSPWCNQGKQSTQQAPTPEGLNKVVVESIPKDMKNQEEHHKTKTFRDKLIDLLVEHQIEFDKKFLD